MTTILHRLYLWVPMLLAALLHNAVHEVTHYVAALALGEPVLEFRFLTNGWLTSQVIYAAPVDERTGAHWLIIAWAPSALTVLIGYVVYLARGRWLTPWPPLNLTLWYVGALFMSIDPLYIGVLSWFIGSDVDAVAAVGWPAWPVRLIALAVLALNAWLVLRWRRLERTQVERYRLPLAWGGTPD